MSRERIRIEIEDLLGKLKEEGESKITRIRVKKVIKLVDKIKERGYLEGYKLKDNILYKNKCSIVYTKEKESIVRAIKVEIERELKGCYSYNIKRKGGVARSYDIYINGIESLEELERELERIDISNNV